MRTSTICFIVLSSAATLASARPNTYLARNLPSASYKRQSKIPSRCISICDSIDNEVNAGYPVSACCPQSFETDYDLGYPLQELALPGQNLARAQSTSPRATATSNRGTVTSSSKTAISTTNPPSTSSSSSGVTTSNSTATLSPSTSKGAAVGMGSRKRGAWVLAAAVVGLVII